MTAPELPSARAIMAQAIRLATAASATERDLAQARTLVLVARELREGSQPLPRRLTAEADVATALGTPLASGGVISQADWERAGGPAHPLDAAGVVPTEPVSAPFYDAAAAQFGTTIDGGPAYLAPPQGDEPSPGEPAPDTTAVLPAPVAGVDTTRTDFDHLRAVDLGDLRQQFREREIPYAPPGAVSVPLVRDRQPGEGTEGTCRFCGHAIVYARQNREQADPLWFHTITSQRVCPTGVGPDSGHTFATPIP